MSKPRTEDPIQLQTRANPDEARRFASLAASEGRSVANLLLLLVREKLDGKKKVKK